MPARASTTSTPSRRRSPAGCRNSTLLSHDLFEGMFARAGLASDIEVVEEFPVALRCRRRCATIAGRAATGSCCRGFSGAAGSRGRADRASAHSGDRPLENAGQSAAHAVGAGWRSRLAGRMDAAVRRRSGLDHFRRSRRSCCRRLIPVVRRDPSAPRRHHARAAICARSAAICGSPATQSALHGHVPGASGVADERCDRAHLVPSVRHAPQSARMGHRRPRRRSAPGSIFSASIGAWPAPWSSPPRRSFVAWLSGHGSVAAGGAIRGALGRFAGGRALGQPVAARRRAARRCRTPTRAPCG